MKYYFIVNPVSGKGRTTEIIPMLEEYFRDKDLDWEIYITKCPGDGTEFVRKICQEGKPVRLYACGGDGTLFEIVNGAYRYENAEIGLFPLGSGNDFMRYFGNREDFMDIEAQIYGKTRILDLIQCGDRVSHNICSLGLDAEVASNVARFKKLPLVSGLMAYNLSLIYCLMSKVRNHFRIIIDDAYEFEGDYMLALAANSRWYGGGYKGAPLAEPDDGLLDIIFINTISRLRVPALLKKYFRGEHLSFDFCHYHQGKKVQMIPVKQAAVNMDGEIRQQEEATFEILEKAFRFILPEVPRD